MPLLLTWTQSYTPNSIHGILVKLLSAFGIDCMFEHTKKSLIDWIEFVDSNRLMQTDFEQILSFYKVVDTLKGFLKGC